LRRKTVRIDPNVPVPNNGGSGRTSETKSAGAQSSGPSGPSASAGPQLAADSANISAFATQLGNFPAVRQDRVQALRQAVQSGAYSVGGTQVAQSILGDLYGLGTTS
jgi:flagellar biosynthesis anti-sigma factor FlgM